MHDTMKWCFSCLDVKFYSPEFRVHPKQMCLGWTQTHLGVFGFTFDSEIWQFRCQIFDSENLTNNLQ